LWIISQKWDKKKDANKAQEIGAKHGAHDDGKRFDNFLSLGHLIVGASCFCHFNKMPF
jgi:hypothetical protein